MHALSHSEGVRDRRISTPRALHESRFLGSQTPLRMTEVALVVLLLTLLTFAAVPARAQYQPIPNYSGVGAGQQFRNNVNNHLSGVTPIAPRLVSLSQAQLLQTPEQDGQVYYCWNCAQTPICGTTGQGAIALGSGGQWTCNEGPLTPSGPPTGNASGDLSGAYPGPTVRTVLRGQTPVTTSDSLNALSPATGNYSMNTNLLRGLAQDQATGDALSRNRSSLSSLTAPASNFGMSEQTFQSVGAATVSGEPLVGGVTNTVVNTQFSLNSALNPQTFSGASACERFQAAEAALAARSPGGGVIDATSYTTNQSWTSGCQLALTVPTQLHLGGVRYSYVCTGFGTANQVPTGLINIGVGAAGSTVDSYPNGSGGGLPVGAGAGANNNAILDVEPCIGPMPIIQIGTNTSSAVDIDGVSVTGLNFVWNGNVSDTIKINAAASQGDVFTRNTSSSHIAYGVSACSETSNTVTLTTSQNHDFAANQYIRAAGIAAGGQPESAYDGVYLVTGVTSNTVSYFDPIAGLGSCGNSGTVASEASQQIPPVTIASSSLAANSAALTVTLGSAPSWLTGEQFLVIQGVTPPYFNVPVYVQGACNSGNPCTSFTVYIPEANNTASPVAGSGGTVQPNEAGYLVHYTVPASITGQATDNAKIEQNQTNGASLASFDMPGQCDTCIMEDNQSFNSFAPWIAATAFYGQMIANTANTIGGYSNACDVLLWAEEGLVFTANAIEEPNGNALANGGGIADLCVRGSAANPSNALEINVNAFSGDTDGDTNNILTADHAIDFDGRSGKALVYYNTVNAHTGFIPASSSLPGSSGQIWKWEGGTSDGGNTSGGDFLQGTCFAGAFTNACNGLSDPGLNFYPLRQYSYFSTTGSAEHVRINENLETLGGGSVTAQNGSDSYPRENLIPGTGFAVGNGSGAPTTVINEAAQLAQSPAPFANCPGVTSVSSGTCNTAGQQCAITDDSTVCAFGATIVNGGSHKVLGYCDGTQYVMTECK